MHQAADSQVGLGKRCVRSGNSIRFHRIRLRLRLLLCFFFFFFLAAATLILPRPRLPPQTLPFSSRSTDSVDLPQARARCGSERIFCPRKQLRGTMICFPHRAPRHSFLPTDVFFFFRLELLSPDSPASLSPYPALLPNRPKVSSKMAPASSSRRRSATLTRAAAVAAAALFAAAALVGPTSAAAAAANPLADAAVAAVVPDPSPSLRGVGNTLYTTLKSNTSTANAAFGASNNGTSVIKGAFCRRRS